MTRWFLAAAACLAVAIPGLADEPKKKANPFTDPKAKVEAPSTADEKTVQVAHIKLSGDLEEGPDATESLFGAPPEHLRNKLDRIRKAAKDENVKALYLRLGGIKVGFGKLHELQQAVADFRKSGKKVYAYAEELGTKDYLLALSGDQVVLPESGGLSLYGLRAEVTYYKGTLDLLKLKADVLKMGAYKSAVEPFIQDHMSKENREQNEALLDDMYRNEIVAGVVAARPEKKFTPEQVEGIIDQGPFTARKAHALGLIDKLAYEDQFEADVKKAAGEGAKIVRDYGKAKAEEPDLSNPFAVFAALGGKKKKAESKEPKIAVIYAVGPIESGKGGSPNPLAGGDKSVGSETMVAAIRQADKDETVKAIVLRVDSPGGSALASDMIWRALTACKKPVVTSMGDVAASGGYYIAMAGKKIYAEPGTITGSIGVFGMKLVTGGLENWGGMKTEVVQRGKNSGVNSTTFEWTESERKAIQETMEEIYEQFLDKAAAGRKAAGKDMGKEDVRKLAGGRIWTGRQAKANGLVDELGTLADAIAEAKKQAGIDPNKEMELLTLPKPVSFLDRLMEGDVDIPFLGSAELRLIPGAERALRAIAPLLRTQKEPTKMMLPYIIEWK